MAFLYYVGLKFVPVIFVLLLALLLLAVGIGIFTGYPVPETVSDTIFSHINDTVLLQSDVDSFSFSNVTVKQCADLNEGDDNQNIEIFVQKSKETKLQKSLSTFQSPIYNQDTSSYKSGIQDFLYLLPNSTFTYHICIAGKTEHKRHATYFLFDDPSSYLSYVRDHENGEVYSRFSKDLTVGSNNVSSCTEISYNITLESYYFMMVRSPAEITFSYNFTLHQIAYAVENVKPYCKIGSINSCEISLQDGDILEHVKYNILAFIQPSIDSGSIVTHVCVSLFGGSTTLKRLNFLSILFLSGGGILLAITVMLILWILVLRVHVRKHRYDRYDNERQRLLNHN